MTAGRTTNEMARGVLLGTFVADALGARWEGSPAVDLDEAHRRLEQSESAPLLRYTDDTQLTFALAEHLCEHPAVEPSGLTKTMREHFEGDRGYARGMFGIVDAWDRGLSPDEAATSVFPDGSFGNGAAMRVAPVGLVWRHDIAALRRTAQTQAAVTHAHPVGKDAAAAQAHAVAIAATAGAFTVEDLHGLAAAAETAELQRTLGIAAAVATRHLDGPMPYPEVAEIVGTGVLADQSVPAALFVAATAGSLPDAVVVSLALGGDVDTIAAMACAVMGAADGDSDIPGAWLDRLEDGDRGRRYAVALADRLADAADRAGGIVA